MNVGSFKIPLIVCVICLLVGCSQIDVPKTLASPAHPTAESIPTMETKTTPVMPSQEDDMPKDPPLPIPKNPGLPALIEKASRDLAERLSIPASQIKAMETKEVFWPDGSLGCPQPGIIYAQIPTPGYLIMLVHAGTEFEYHASIHGDILYCENPTPPVSGSPTDVVPFRIAPP